MDDIKLIHSDLEISGTFQRGKLTPSKALMMRTNTFSRLTMGILIIPADWVAHVPKDVLAKKFGVDQSVFDSVPTVDPYILNGTASTHNVTSPNGAPTGKSSYAYHTLQHDSEPVPEGGGTFYNIDSRAFPVSTTIAVTFVTLKPKGLRELHWYPTVEEWLNFHSGTGHASVFIGGTNSHTFDFPAGDTAAFPDNSGYYIESKSDAEDLVWIEPYEADRAADISLTQ